MVGRREGTGIEMQAHAKSPSDLLVAQRKAIEIILSGIGQAIRRPNGADAPGKTERPNQTFLIDGGRGSGKTFTLLTVQSIVDEISGNDPAAQAHNWQALGAKHGVQKLNAKVLRIIFPGEFTAGEMLMEYIFAAIRRDLDEAETDFKEMPTELAAARALRTTLLERVARGWYFAQRFGLEAVIRDAIDYENLVESWSRESMNASRRIEEWREFVSSWLKLRKRNLLVILLDDSDNDESLTENILHTLRLVLDHPQIVTIIAGNLAAMRESLIQLRMEKLSRSVSAVDGGMSMAAKEWRRKLRREVEEYLEKVIPQQQRAYLTVSSAGAGTEAPDEKRYDDFEKIVGVTLKTLVARATRETRLRFLDVKFALALRHEEEKTDAPNYEERRQLEPFLSWWLFGNLYAAELQPRSVRNLRTMRHYYYGPEPEKESEGDPTQWSKRLPVALFGMSANFELIQRLNDEDVSVPAWLRQQRLRSDWSQRRSFIVNDRELPTLSYANAFLRYRLDIGMGMPFRDNADEVVPTELLPHPLGRRHLRRFFQPRQSPRRHRRLGVARWLDHAAIPSNCMYFYDLMALPDDAFIDVERLPEKERSAAIDDLQTGRWEGSLADEWLSKLEDDQETDADEFLARYFREIVCETLRKTEIIPSGELLNLMDPPEIADKQNKAIYEHFVSDELKSFNENFRKRAGAFQSLIAERFSSNENVRAQSDDSIAEMIKIENRDSPFRGFKNPPRMLALYMSLASDLRRAWHAIRIYQFAPAVLGRLQDDVELRDERAIVANKDRLRLYKCKSIKDELLKDQWVSRVMNNVELFNIRDVFKGHFEELPEIIKEISSKDETKELYIDSNIKIVREKLIDPVIVTLKSHDKSDLDKVTAVRELLRAFGHAGIGKFASKWFSIEVAGWANESEALINEAVSLENLPTWSREICELPNKKALEIRNPEAVKGEGAEAVNDEDREAIAIAQGRFRLYLRDIDLRRLFSATESLSDTTQIEEEVLSFDTWTRTLRNAARFLSDGWPFHDSVLSNVAAELELKVFKPLEGEAHPGGLLQILQSENTRVSEAVNDARSARNFTLCLYGLAPCLPAVIHANVMSRVYEAKLRLQAVRNDDYIRGRAVTLRVVERSISLIRDAIDEVDQWAFLVGQLSVILRCVKIKALHLDFRLMMQSCGRQKQALDEQASKQAANKPPNKATNKPVNKVDQTFLRAIRRNKIADEEIAYIEAHAEGDPELPKRIFERCEILIQQNKAELINGLAIFPDMAPSTLFGEGWIGDLVSRPAFMGLLFDKLRVEGFLKETEERHGPVEADRTDPDRVLSEASLSVSGIFGETEQWLWAANRALRKLREEIIKDTAALIPETNEDAGLRARFHKFISEQRNLDDADTPLAVPRSETDLKEFADAIYPRRDEPGEGVPPAPAKEKPSPGPARK